MMNTPSMYSVDQLLKARQNGVPDYVVVPMLQKAMAQKQAMAQQQALQQGMNPPPPVADQILDAAHNDVMQEHMARNQREEMTPVPSSRKETKGIDSLPSGIDESDYAHGGIIAFAGIPEKEGGDGSYVEEPVVIYADDPEHLRRTQSLAGISHRDRETGEMVVSPHSSLNESYNDEYANWAKNYHGLPADTAARKYIGNVGKEKQDRYVKQFLNSAKLSPDTIIDTNDRDLMHNIIGTSAMLEQGIRKFTPDVQEALAAGKPYVIKSSRGDDDSTPSSQRAPQQESTQNPTGGIANLTYPSAPEEQQQPYTKEETTPEYEGKRLQDYLGEDPNAAKREARLSKREADLSEEKDRSPWLALMQAGLSTMAGTSPNAFANIGAGASEGLKAYGEARKDLSKSSDKLMDLRGEIEDAQYAHQQAVKTHGWDSAEANKKANMLVAKENQKAKWDYKKDAAEFELKKFEAENKGNLQGAEAEYYQSGKSRNNQAIIDSKSEALKTKQMADISRTVNAEVTQFAKQQDPKTLTLPSQEQIDNYRAAREKYHMGRYGMSSSDAEVAPPVNVGNPNYNVKNYFK